MMVALGSQHHDYGAMDIEVRRTSKEEQARAIETCELAFGWNVRPDDMEAIQKTVEPERTFAAVEGDRFVGAGANYAFELTVPGGHIPAAGLTLVGVLPSHRRRGILSKLMREFLTDAHDRSEAVSVLWASESIIYQRYGYGLAARHMSIQAERAHMRFLDDSRSGETARLLTASEAVTELDPIYEKARSTRPGMFARSETWWREHRLRDPEQDREGASPLWVVIIDIEDEPSAYALYRIKGNWEDGVPRGTVQIAEAISTSSASAKALWRYLFGVDLIETVESHFMPVDSPLPLMVSDPRRIKVRISDCLWLRVVDVPAALRGRSYAAADRIGFEIRDDIFDDNAGIWTLDTTGSAEVSHDGTADLSMDVRDLGAAYLGGTTMTSLVEAGRATENTTGAATRFDAMFRSAQAPWCPEIF